MRKMGIGMFVDTSYYEIGAWSFFHSFFSTVSYHLEPDGWGSRFPILMNNLYSGTLAWTDAPQALIELMGARKELEAFPPDKVIWDIEDLTKQPPWGDNIDGTITNLSNYFGTNDGEDLFDVLTSALVEAINRKQDVLIQ